MIRNLSRVRLLIFVFLVAWLILPSTVPARTISAGWQMVTLSLDKEEPVTHLFGDQISRINALWSYSEQNGWEVYSAREHLIAEANTGGIPLIQTIKPNTGYWINLTRDMSLPDLPSVSTPNITNPLAKPWTLVGCPESIRISASTTSFDCWTVPEGYFISAVYEYDGSLVERVPGHDGFELLKGKAYWIKIHPDGLVDRQLTLPDFHGLKRLPDLPFAVSNPCMAVGEQNQIWFAGGVTNSGISSSVFFYDFETRNFLFRESIPSSQSVSICSFESGAFQVFSTLENNLNGAQAVHTYTPTTHSEKIVTVALDLPIINNGSSHTSHVFQNLVYILGGDGGSGGGKKIDVFRVTDTGELKLSNLGTAFNTPRSIHTSHLVNSLLIVIGGRGPVGLVEAFSISEDGRLSEHDNNRRLIEPRFHHTSHYTGSDILILGGEMASGILTNSVEAIHLTSQNTLQDPIMAGNMLTARAEHSSHFDGEYLYVIGGREQSGTALSSIEIYLVKDGNSILFVNRGPELQQPRFQHTSHLRNGYLYVFGGRDQGGNPLSQVEIFKLSGSGNLIRISTTQNLDVGRYKHQSVFNKNSFYIIGGINESNDPTSLIEIFELRDPEDPRRRSIVKNSALRYDHSLLSNNDYIYFIGGIDSTENTTESLAIFHDIPLFHEIRPELKWRVNSRVQEEISNRGTLELASENILAAGGILPNGEKTASMEIIDTQKLINALPGLLFSENLVFSNTSPLRFSLPDTAGSYSCQHETSSPISCAIEERDTLLFQSEGFGFHTLTLNQQQENGENLRSFVDIVVDAYPQLQPLTIPEPILAGQSISLSPETSYPLDLSCLFSFYSTAPAIFTSYGLSSITFQPQAAGEFQVEVTCYSIFGLSASTSIQFQVHNESPIVDFSVLRGFFSNPGTLEIQNQSRDPENKELQFLWSMIHTPQDAVYTLRNTRSTTPLLELITTGEYTLQLTARDPFGQESRVNKAIRINSAPNTILDAKSFTPLSSLDYQVSHASALFANDRVYVVGGQNSSGLLSSVLEISSEDGTILSSRASPFAVEEPNLSFLEPKLFVSGGSQTGVSLTGIHAWDVSLQTWDSPAQNPDEKIEFTYAANTKLHILNSTQSLSVSSYTPAFSDGKIWLFPPKETSEAIILESTNDTTPSSLPYYFDQFNPKIAARSSEIYLSGGVDREGKSIPYIQHLSSEISFFDRRLHLPAEQRIGAAPVIVNGELWLIGGQDLEGNHSNLISRDNHTNIDDEGRVFLKPGTQISLRNTSFDPDPLDILQPSFEILELPGDSSPDLVTASVSNPWKFRPFLEGKYLIKAVYEDSLLLSDEQLIALTVNRIPQIHFFEGGPRSAGVSSTFIITSSVESDDWSTYSYRFLSKPLESLPTLEITTDLSAEFTPDKTGAYLVEIRIEDKLGAVVKRLGEIRVDTHLGPATNTLDVPTSSISFSTIETRLSIHSTDLSSAGLIFWRLVSRPEGSSASISQTLSRSIDFSADVSGSYHFHVQGFRDTEPPGISGTRIKELQLKAIKPPEIQLAPVQFDLDAFRPEIQFPIQIQEFHGHKLSLGFEVSTDSEIFENFLLKEGNSTILFRNPSKGATKDLSAVGLLTQSVEFNKETTLVYQILIKDEVLGLSIPKIAGTTKVLIEDVPPTVEMLTQFPTEITDGRIVLNYRVSDPEGYAAGITVYYRIQGFEPQQALLNTPNENDLHAASPTGIDYQVVWDAHEDLGSNFYTDLEILLVPKDSRSSIRGAISTTVIEFIDYQRLVVDPSEELLKETISVTSIPSLTDQVTTISLFLNDQNEDDSNLVNRVEVQVLPGSFTQDIDLSIGRLLEIPVNRGFGLSVAPSPSVTNTVPVSITISYSNSLLDATLVSDPSLLAIFSRSRLDGQWMSLPTLHDIPRKRFIFSVPDLQFLNEFLITSRLFQPPGIELICDRMMPFDDEVSTFRSKLHSNLAHLSSTGTIALLLRSLDDPLAAYSGEFDMIENLCPKVQGSGLSKRYDAVYTIHYPVASEGISPAASFLSSSFLSKVSDSAALDIYAHGVGGIIARYSLESILSPAEHTTYRNSIENLHQEDSGDGPSEHHNEFLNPAEEGTPLSPILSSTNSLNKIKNLILLNTPVQGARVSNLIESLKRSGFQISTEIRAGPDRNFLAAPQLLNGINELGTFSPIINELRYHQFSEDYPVPYLALNTLSTFNSGASGDGRYEADSFAPIPGFYPINAKSIWFLDLEFDESSTENRKFGRTGFHQNFSSPQSRTHPKWIRSRISFDDEVFSYLKIGSSSYEDLHNYRANPSDIVEGFMGISSPLISTNLPDGISQIDGVNINIQYQSHQLEEVTLWTGIPGEILPSRYTYSRDENSKGAYQNQLLSQCCGSEVLLENWEPVWDQGIFPPIFIRKPGSSDRLPESIAGTENLTLNVSITTQLKPGEFDTDQIAVPIYYSASDWYGNRVSNAKTIIRFLPLSTLDLPTVQTTQNSATLRWNRVSNALGYEVYLWQNDRLLEKRLVSSGDETALFFPALTPSTNYEFQIRAFNDSFTSDWVPIEASTRNAPPPPFPIIIHSPVNESVITTRILRIEGEVQNFEGLVQLRIEDVGVGALEVENEVFSGEIELFKSGENLLNLVAGTLRSTITLDFVPPHSLETVSTTKKTITMNLYEEEVDDGDTVEIILNGKKVLESLTLENHPGRILSIQLRSGVNTLILKLLQEGKIPGHDGSIELSELNSESNTRNWSGNASEERVMIINAP